MSVITDQDSAFPHQIRSAFKLFAINNKPFKNVEIHDYCVDHWCFQLSVLHELNPIYKVTLTKMGGGAANDPGSQGFSTF